MSKKQTLSVLLGLREREEKTFRNMIADMFKKFKNSQGKFMGKRDTYVAEDGFADEPNKRGFTNVSATVAEELDWLKKYSQSFMTIVFTIEKTNAKGVKAPLIVEGENWGEYSTQELLRAKSILDSNFRAMFQELPIRAEDEFWEPHTQPEFGERSIWQTRVNEGYAKTTLKRIEIVNDPHIKDSPGRPPVTQPIDEQVNIGKYTKQQYSGAITNLERAQIEVKYDLLYKAIIQALETANSIEVEEESNLGTRMLDYLIK